MYQDVINKNKIFNDPIYGLITIPNELVFDLIEHPYFQRLRRISQLGLTSLVYPGAYHTRFQHSIGAMHLMDKAIIALKKKGNEITSEEQEALLVAILLHDIGHGPYSHALEQSIIDIDHEQVSLMFMERLNKYFNGKLSLAIKIFKNEYPKKFLHQLISSQLDMDRLDYIKRDSFYTGVKEGTISSERLIKMLNVCKDDLVVEIKGIYSVENFIIARRLMYWQVYLHKTNLAAELMMGKILKRAKYISSKRNIFSSKALKFFLQYTNDSIDNIITQFSCLDDLDIMGAIKEWQYDSDIILSELSNRLVNRNLFKIIIQNQPFDDSDIEKIRCNLIHQGVKKDCLNYYVITGKIQNFAYNMNRDTIKIVNKNGNIFDISRASDQFISQSCEPVQKYYLCYKKYFCNN